MKCNSFEELDGVSFVSVSSR